MGVIYIIARPITQHYWLKKPHQLTVRQHKSECGHSRRLTMLRQVGRQVRLRSAMNSSTDGEKSPVAQPDRAPPSKGEVRIVSGGPIQAHRPVILWQLIVDIT